LIETFSQNKYQKGKEEINENIIPMIEFYKGRKEKVIITGIIEKG
jgi:hypothetical protein